MATGVEKFSCCHPLALSLPNVPVASSWPLLSTLARMHAGID